MQKPPTVWDKVETTKSNKTGLESTLGSTLGSTLAMTGAMSMNNTYSASSKNQEKGMNENYDTKNPTPVPEQDVSFINIPSAREEKTYKEVSHALVPKLELSKSTSAISSGQNKDSVKPPGSNASKNSNKVRTGGF